MVESGLEVRTSVSAYRLALHFFDAVLIYALILWLALDLLEPRRGRRMVIPRSVAAHGWAALVLLSVTMIWGAFTAGLHAGEAYNTWPLMDGKFFPSAATTILPKWVNIFENTAFVQVLHRWLGPTTALAILAWIVRLWRSEHTVEDRRWIRGAGRHGVSAGRTRPHNPAHACRNRGGGAASSGGNHAAHASAHQSTAAGAAGYGCGKRESQSRLMGKKPY